MEAEVILYPHTEASFEVRCLMWDFLAEPFDVIIEDLRLEVVVNPSTRIEELHREILYRRFHREWQTASDIRRFYDCWVREQYAHLFSDARCSEGEIDHSNLVPSDDGPSSQSASVRRTSRSIMETGLINDSRTTSDFEVRRSIRASLTAIFDTRLEHLRFLFEEDPESHMERIQRAILNNEPHHHWGSVTDMYRFYEGRIRAWCPHLFSRARVIGDENDFPPGDPSGASTMDAMTRNVPNTQTVGDAFSEDSTGHSIEQAPTDVRIEDAGMSHSSNGNAVTFVAPIDIIVPHPESSSGADEAHPRPESNEERDSILRGARWPANDPEPQTPYDRNQRLLFHINELMEIVRSSGRTEDPDTSISQEGRNDSNTSLGGSQANPSASPIPLVRPEEDFGISSRGEGGVGRGGGGRHLASETLTAAGVHAESRDSESWIHDFAISHPNIRATVPFRPPPPVPTQRRNVSRRRRTRQPSTDASSSQRISADNRQTRLRGAPVQPRVRLVMRPGWWIRHVRASNRRRDEVPRFAAASGQRQFDTREMPFGRDCYENYSLPVFVKC